MNRNINRNNNIKKEKRNHDIVLKDNLKNNKRKIYLLAIVNIN